MAILTAAGRTNDKTADLEITSNDNPSMNNGQMVLQVQPVKSTLKGSDILARSLDSPIERKQVANNLRRLEEPARQQHRD
jgi:hypothetical protein